MSFQALGEAVDIVAGQHIEASLYSSEPIGSAYLTGPADFGETRPRVTKWTSAPKVFAKASDVLVTVKGAGVGKSNLGCDAAIGRQLMALRPKQEKVLQSYLFHFIRYKEQRIAGLADGATVPGIGKADLANLQIPLPPLDEQKRIAAILDKADQLRQKRRQAIALLDSLTQSIFLEMFEYAHETPYVQIGEFCTVKGGKRLPKGHDYIDADEGHYYLRVSDFQKSNLTKQSLKRISRGTHQEIRRYTVSSGELAISIAGTIGETVLISEALDGVNLTENAAKISISNSQIADPTYLQAAISMPHAQKQIASSTGQVTIGKLALFRIEKIEIPLPAIDKQIKFATLVREIKRQKHNYMASVDFSDDCFKSLQHRAFTSQL